MDTTRLVLDPKFRVAPVHRRTFGSFVEHLGRCVYSGIYEPGHPTADPDGFRRDVIDLVRELGVTTVRYPGGNFVSGYRWEDGVGPREQRPTRLDLAWHSIETNEFGLDQFIRWARAAEVEPMLALNLGTRGVQEAVDLVEYCNIQGGTALSDARIRNGAAETHDVRMWCLGNEMDGPWQVGHKTASEYGRLAAETARAIRMVDPGLELVACGSSNAAIPSFGAWETTVLTECYEQVDYLSLHAYYAERDGDQLSFLASGAHMDLFIHAVVASVDSVRARLRSSKRMMLSFDEWNVWYQDAEPSRLPDAWVRTPRLLEERYSVTDAVVVGGLLISLLRNSDRVTSACLAQLVNVIAPIVTEPGGPAWRQTIFHPFALTSRHAIGDVLNVAMEGPVLTSSEHGEVGAVDAVATLNESTGSFAVFVVNRAPSAEAPIEIRLTVNGHLKLIEVLTLFDPDPHASNRTDHLSRVAPVPLGGATLDGRTVRATLPPASWSMIRINAAGGVPPGTWLVS